MKVYFAIVLISWIIQCIRCYYIIPSLTSRNTLMVYMVVTFMMSNVFAIILTIILKILVLLFKIYNG